MINLNDLIWLYVNRWIVRFSMVYTSCILLFITTNKLYVILKVINIYNVHNIILKT